MRVDKSIHLDVSADRSGPGADPDRAGTQDRRRQPDPGAREAFKQAMAGDAGQPDGTGYHDQGAGGKSLREHHEGPPPPAPDALVSPFDLLASSRSLPSRPAVSVDDATAMSRLLPLLRDSVHKLWVQVRGNEAPQVRVELDNDALPGVTVHLQERGGRLEIAFSCEGQKEFGLLSRQADAIAGKLASRLGRDVLVCVASTHGHEEPVEFLGLAGSGRT